MLITLVLGGRETESLGCLISHEVNWIATLRIHLSLSQHYK